MKESIMIDKMMSLVPRGQGTYITALAGVVVSWIVAIIPAAGAVIGFDATWSMADAWSATWVGMLVMFGRRALAT
jgi:flagellar biosynthesis protein FliR